MRRNIIANVLLFVGLFSIAHFSFGQVREQGSLFIIGGGERSSALIHDLVQTAELRTDDYIVILPMATSVPEESVAYISEQLREHSTHPIVSFNFTKAQADTQTQWIDSVRNARLIYMTGGDQNKLMDVIRGTKLYDALHEAYRSGSTISGTSAGAAVMSEQMITGSHVGGSESSTFNQVRPGLVETAQGLGFLNRAVIDQHFIMRSRYNRLLSVLMDYPNKMMIGIDEGTALVVKGKNARVVGDSQVVVVSFPRKRQQHRITNSSFHQAQLSLFSHGQSFKLK